MAHQAFRYEAWDKDERHPRVIMSTHIAAFPDDEWEEKHMAFLGFDDRLAIAFGCQDCAEAIAEILDACLAHSQEEESTTKEGSGG